MATNRRVNRNSPNLQGEGPDKAYVEITQRGNFARELHLSGTMGDSSIFISNKKEHSAEFLIRTAMMFLEIADEMLKEEGET